MSEEDFETVLKHIDHFISPQEMSGGHCAILSLLFKFISIWCVWFFIIIMQSVLVLLNHSKFEVLTVEMMSLRMKYWMKQRVNRSNMKIDLDGPENVE